MACPANFLQLKLESGLLKDGQMKRARFTEEQIIGVLREHEAEAKTGLSEREDMAVLIACRSYWKRHFRRSDPKFIWRAFPTVCISERRRFSRNVRPDFRISNLS